MKAIVIPFFGGSELLSLEEVETPRPKDNEVLIETYFAAVNPVDWKIRDGWLKKRLEHQFPLIPGWDVAGKIKSVGSTVSNPDLKAGTPVFAYARKPVVQWGTYAEYVTVRADHVAIMPESTSFAESASIPLVALTAWQALFDKANLQEGQTVLIHAGAGGVGSLAIQLAKWKGAKVYTTASQRNHEYVKSLGADVAIDYPSEDFVDVMRELEPNGVDLALDCVGETVFEKSIQLVKKGGWLVSICRLYVDHEIDKEFGIHTDFIFVEPSGQQLQEIARLLDEKKIHPPHLTEFPLKEAAAAQDLVYKGHTKGKVVLKVKE